MPNPETRKKLSMLALLALPIAVVKLITVMVGHPAQALGQISQTPVSIAEVSALSAAPVKWLPEQLAAAQYVQALRERPFGPAPLYFERSSQKETLVKPTEIVLDPSASIRPTAPLAPPPNFTLSAIMSAASGRTAVLNGRAYREGEIIKGTTWTLQFIDAEERSATLRDSQSDRTLIVSVELPQS